MIKFRSPIYKDVEKEKTITKCNCFHCGKPYFVATKNLRSSNYCNDCK